MNTHVILIIVQYISVTVLFAEVLVVFSRWKNSIHSYLLLACASSFISNLGYLFELQAGSEEAYVTALKLSYAGRVWIVFAFFLFAAKMCSIRIPKWILAALLTVHVAIYISVLMIGENGLYYKDFSFTHKSGFPEFYHSNGTVHDLFMGLNAILSLLAFYWVIREYRKEDNKRSRRRLLMVSLAFGVQIFSFILETMKLVPILKYYDLTMPGILFGTLFMLIGILRFDLLGTREIAKDFAIDRISEGVIAVDNQGRVQYFNEPAASIYPQFDTFYSSKTTVPNEEPILTPYDIIAKIESAVRDGGTLSSGGRIYSPEENDLIYEGESYGKLYALVDDTEHYRFMKELKEQKDRADSANEAKSRFLANMSHEIRTPINAVLGMDEMILREAKEKSIRSYAADIMSAGKTLLSLINDILDLSKVEEGRMEIIPVQYDLSSLINDLVNMIRDRAVKKGLKFNLKADEHIPHILIGDEIRIRQCVMNLLTNAVKYTETGEVTFEISYTEKSRDYILLCFKVTDTGIGMKEDDMENLFSPYKRIEEKRNRAIEGTGLGMSITRQLLALMGSDLSVHSKYGKGSEFSFAVEQEVVKWEEMGDIQSRLDDAVSDTYEYHELFHAPDACILVVDDTEMNLTVMQSLLKKTDIRIDTALSGRDAVRMAWEKQYDVIFIDHMMPDMDGIETLSNIRNVGKSKLTPAVALTANAISGAREMYLEAGFTDYLSKPVDGIKLERMLAALLPGEKVIKSEEDSYDAKTDIHHIDEEVMNSVFSEGLSSITEIDAQKGLKNCGTEEGYRSVLMVFHQTAKSKADEIEEYYNKQDVGNFAVKVHALKSSARIVGADALSELAKSLEDAAKAGDAEFVDNNTNKLLEMYRELDEKLSWLDKSDDNLPEISDKALKEAWQTIGEIAEAMDYGMMENILDSLKGYRLRDEDQDKADSIGRLLTELDWDGILRVVNGK